MAPLSLTFAVLTRTQLDGNLSAAVTLKQKGELMCSGLFSLVRHPIFYQRHSLIGTVITN